MIVVHSFNLVVNGGDCRPSPSIEGAIEGRQRVLEGNLRYRADLASLWTAFRIRPGYRAERVGKLS